MNGDILVTYVDDQLFVDANDAIAQVRALQQENATLVSLFEVASRRHREVVDRLVLDNEALQEDVMKHALNNGMLVKCVTDRNDMLKELVLEMYQTMVDRCEGPHAPYHGKPCSSCAEAGSSDCPKVIAERMRKLGIEVDE